MGEHGFKSQELQLIGPSLIGCGFLFCLLRLFFCSTPACCTVCCKKGTSLDEKALLSPSRETLTEDTTEVQQRQQQEPQRLPQLQKITNQLVRNKHRTKKKKEQEEQEVQKVLVVPSNIPNFIEDEGDEDEDLGLKVEYIDEVGQEATPRRNLEPFASNSRPASSHSHNSTASKVSKIDGHSITRQNSEILLDPATLERPEG
ncbi:uncharacterized protein [Cherax quadricarinatus]|uniref:uncharacterized protein n=1 Tax=Cherax quadricarinatus TaxID=27406 RepID=UPI00387E4CC5